MAAVEEKAFQPRVALERSKPSAAEMAFGGFFYLAVLVQFVLAAVVLSSQNSNVVTFEVDGPATCPDGMLPSWECCGGFVYESLDCVSEALCKEMQDCAPSCRSRRLHGGSNASAPAAAAAAAAATWREELRALEGEAGAASARRLQLRRAAARLLAGVQRPAENVWAFFEEHFYVPMVLFVALFCAAFLWLVLLLKAATPVIWGTIVFDLILFVVVFFYFLVEHEEICYPAIIFAVVGAIAAGVLRKQINAAGKVLGQAMKALEANKRLFTVAFGVQLVWAAYFAYWIASLIAMFFTKTAATEVVEGQERCVLTPKYPLGAFYTIWLVVYYWTSYFMQNVSLCVMTVQVGGWYFQQDGSSSLWVKALKWSLTSLAGGNAICSAILGVTRYLAQYVNSKIRFCVAILDPIEWIPLCLAFALKQCIFTYTKFGFIGQCFTGKDFCSNAKATSSLLKARLGEAVLTDYLGARVMSWATYVLCVGLAFATLAWSEELQGLSIIAELGLMGNIFVMLFLAYFISQPFLCLVLIVLFENMLGAILNFDYVIRGVFNSILAALFIGAISNFIMKFVSLIVVDAMNIIFFCFAVETDNGRTQERFADLYDIIKKSVAQGVPAAAPAAGGAVVMGTAPTEGGKPEQAVNEGEANKVTVPEEVTEVQV